MPSVLQQRSYALDQLTAQHLESMSGSLNAGTVQLNGWTKPASHGFFSPRFRRQISTCNITSRWYISCTLSRNCRATITEF